MEDVTKGKIQSSRESPVLSPGSSNMAISIHGQCKDAKKSPWNFEKHQTDLERRMMERLETSRHGIHQSDDRMKEWPLVGVVG